MFQRQEVKRILPLFLFWAGYTFIFFLWIKTFFYTLPFLLGLLIAVAIQPLVRFLERKLSWSHIASAAAATGVAVGFILLSLAVLGVITVREISTFILRASEDGFSQFSQPVADFLNKIGHYLQRLDLNFFEQNQQEVMTLLQNGWEVIVGFLGTLLGVLTSLPTVITLVIVTVFSVFFIARDFTSLRSWLSRLLSAGVVSHMRNIGSRKMGKICFLSYLLLYFITFCETVIILAILGIPYPLTIGLITAIADILPVLGPGIVFLPLAIYQILIGQYAKTVGVLIGWGVISLIRQIAEPKLISSSTKIHPLSMLAAVYFSLVKKSFWIFFYVMFFFILYSALRKSGALPALLESDEEKTQKGISGDEEQYGDPGIS